METHESQKNFLNYSDVIDDTRFLDTSFYYLCCRITIIVSGPSSAGKTALCNDWCKRHPQFYFVEEVARKVMKEKSIDRPKLHSYIQNISNGKFLQFHQDIFDQQNSVEQESSVREFVIVDRGPDPVVFITQSMSYDDAFKLANSPSARACFERYKSDDVVLVIMCPLDTIEDDGVRYVPTKDEQYEYVDILKHFLYHLGIQFHYCDKTSRNARVKWLEELLQMTFHQNY